MDKKKKRTLITAVGILVIIIGAAAIAYLFFYSYGNREPEYFVSNKKNKATKLYNEIMESDLLNNYPETAAGVMDLNNKINLLIYGNMLLNDELLDELLEKQRMLFSESLTNSISFEEQYENLVSGLEKYKELKTKCYDIVQESPQRHPDDENLTIIKAVWETDKMGEVIWEYILEENEDKQYKILRFQTAQ